MAVSAFIPTAKFVNTHFVDEQYHQQHSQLVHRHRDVLELFYVMKGEGRYIVGNREYAIQPGSLVICNADILHGEALFQEHAMQSYCCVLRDVYIPNMPPNTLMAPTHTPILQLTMYKQPVEHMLLALHALTTQSLEDRHICEMLANAVLEIVYKDLLNSAITNDPIKQKTEELIRNITEYLDEHFMENVSLQQLGNIFHMSHYYLAHVFKTETGLSPMKYVMHRKIGEIQSLLMNTDMLISEIGETLGFSDHCHLCSAFKKYIGVTPSQYRKHFQSNKVTTSKTAQEESV